MRFTDFKQFTSIMCIYLENCFLFFLIVHHYNYSISLILTALQDLTSTSFPPYTRGELFRQRCASINPPYFPFCSWQSHCLPLFLLFFFFHSSTTGLSISVVSVRFVSVLCFHQTPNLFPLHLCNLFGFCSSAHPRNKEKNPNTLIKAPPAGRNVSPPKL